MYGCFMALHEMAVPDLDGLIAEVDRTCTSSDWVDRLATAADIANRLQTLGDNLIEEFVEHCRFTGRSWADIGAALGVTRQAAQQKFLSPHREYDSSEFSKELSAAMVQMKQAAVQRRHNYIGTEHLLLGLLSADNTAAAALRACGTDPGHLQTAIDSMLSVGASQAAERIAWTPYARRAIATAKELASQAGDAGPMSCFELLVGLLRLGRGVAATVLSDAGINEGRLDEVVSK